MSAPAVVLVVHPGSELYGSDRMVAEAVEALVEAGLAVHVALPTSGPLVDELTRRGASCRTVAMPVLRKTALRPKGFAALATATVRSVAPTSALLHALRPDVVYVSTQILPTWLVAGRLARAVTVCHVHEAERHPSRLVELGLVAPLLLAHRVLANSRYSAEGLAEVIPRLRRRTTVVYNGIAAPDEPAPPRPELDRPVRLLYVGRLSPRKGPDVALAATRLLRDAGVEVTLDLLGGVFAGYEWFEAQLRQQYADLVAQGAVRFLGFDASVWPLLAAHDIALVPSTAPEPFGNTAVEATLARRPVVVSRIGGLPEAVDGTASAVVVTPADAEALAAGIGDVVSNWARYTATTREAAAEARVRFAPQRFRREVATAVLDALAVRRGSADPQLAQRHLTVGGRPTEVDVVATKPRVGSGHGGPGVEPRPGDGARSHRQAQRDPPP